MDPSQMQQLYQEYFYYILIAGVIIGLVAGAVPLFLSIPRRKRKIGLIAFLVCGIAGAFSPLLAIIVAVVFIIVILR